MCFHFNSFIYLFEPEQRGMFDMEKEGGMNVCLLFNKENCKRVSFLLHD